MITGIAETNPQLTASEQPRLEIRHLGIPLVSVVEVRRAKRRSRSRMFVIAALLITASCLGLAFVK